MDTYDFMKYAHAGIGALALLTFWLSGMTRKGGAVHTASGKIYLLAMTGILLSAAGMLAGFAERHHPVAAAFLGYLLVITGTSVWCSWRAIRDKHDWPAYTGTVFKLLMVLNGLSGLAIAYIGLFVTTQMQVIITAFSLIGIANAISMRRFAQTPPENPRWWLKEHFGAMIGNGVATHIAFLTIGLPKLLPMLSGPLLQHLAWLGPLSVSIGAGVYLNRKYMKPRKPSVNPMQTA